MFAIEQEFIEPCRTVDPEIFFRKWDEEKAKALCRSCRIQLLCLERTLDTERDLGHQIEGVHGGLTKAERANTKLTRIA